MLRVGIVWALIMSSIVISLSSCDKVKGDIFSDEELLDKLYNNSFDTLVVGVSRYALNPYLYRNFFPGVLNKKRPLIASIELVNIDSLPVLESIAIRNLYIINKNLIWQSLPSLSERTYLPDNKLRWVGVDGPEWDPGIYVDVILEIEDNTTSTTFFLIRKEQLIERLD